MAAETSLEHACRLFWLTLAKARSRLVPTFHRREGKLAAPFELCSSSMLLAAAHEARLSSSGDVML